MQILQCSTGGQISYDTVIYHSPMGRRRSARVSASASLPDNVGSDASVVPESLCPGRYINLRACVELVIVLWHAAGPSKGVGEFPGLVFCVFPLSV